MCVKILTDFPESLYDLNSKENDRVNALNFILMIVQRDETQSSLFIILRVHSTSFLQRSQAWPRWREVAAQKV